MMSDRKTAKLASRFIPSSKKPNRSTNSTRHKLANEFTSTSAVSLSSHPSPQFYETTPSFSYSSPNTEVPSPSIFPQPSSKTLGGPPHDSDSISITSIPSSFTRTFANRLILGDDDTDTDGEIVVPSTSYKAISPKSSRDEQDAEEDESDEDDGTETEGDEGLRSRASLDATARFTSIHPQDLKDGLNKEFMSSSPQSQNEWEKALKRRSGSSSSPSNAFRRLSLQSQDISPSGSKNKNLSARREDRETTPNWDEEEGDDEEGFADRSSNWDDENQDNSHSYRYSSLKSNASSNSKLSESQRPSTFTRTSVFPLHHYSEAPYASTSSLSSRPTASPTSTPGGSAINSPADLPLQLPSDEDLSSTASSSAARQHAGVGQGYPSSHPYMAPNLSSAAASSSSYFKTHAAAVSESWDEDFLFGQDADENEDADDFMRPQTDESRQKNARKDLRKSVAGGSKTDTNPIRRNESSDESGLNPKIGKRKKEKEKEKGYGSISRTGIIDFDEDDDNWDESFLPQENRSNDNTFTIPNSTSSRTITTTLKPNTNSAAEQHRLKAAHSRSQSGISTTSTSVSNHSGKSLALTDISGRLARQSDVSSWRTRKSSGSEKSEDESLDRPISWNTSGSGSRSGSGSGAGSYEGKGLGWPASLNPVKREEHRSWGSGTNRSSQRSSASGQTDALRQELGVSVDEERRSWGSNPLAKAADLVIDDEADDGGAKLDSKTNCSNNSTSISRLRPQSLQTSWTGDEPTRRHALYVSSGSHQRKGVRANSGSDTESALSLNGDSGEETETESVLGLSHDPENEIKKEERRSGIALQDTSIPPLSTSASSSASTPSAVQKLSAAASRAFPQTKKMNHDMDSPNAGRPSAPASATSHRAPSSAEAGKAALSTSPNCAEEGLISPRLGKSWNPFRGSKFGGNAPSSLVSSGLTSPLTALSLAADSEARTRSSSAKTTASQTLEPGGGRKNLFFTQDTAGRSVTSEFPPSPSKQKERIRPTRSTATDDVFKAASKHKVPKSLSTTFGLNNSRAVEKENKLANSTTSSNLGTALLSNPQASSSADSLSSVKAVVDSGQERQPDSSTSGSGKAGSRRDREKMISSKSSIAVRKISSPAQSQSSAICDTASPSSSRSGTLHSQTSRESIRKITGKRRGSEALGASAFSSALNRSPSGTAQPGPLPPLASTSGSARRIAKGKSGLRGDGYNGPSAATSPLLSSTGMSSRSTSNSTATSTSANGSDIWADSAVSSQSQLRRRAGDGSWGSETSYSYGSSQEKDSIIEGPGARTLASFASRRPSTTSDSDTSTKGVAGNNRHLGRAPRFTIRRKGTDSAGSPSLAQVNELQQSAAVDARSQNKYSAPSVETPLDRFGGFAAWPTAPAISSIPSSSTVDSRQIQTPSPTMHIAVPPASAGPAATTLSKAPKDGLMRRSSLSDLKIPARITKAQESLRANIGFVRDFAKGIEDLKALQVVYQSELASIQGDPGACLSRQIISPLSLSPESQLRASQLEEEYATWWECADVLVGLGEGRSEADESARVDSLTHSPLTSRERCITLENPNPLHTRTTSTSPCDFSNDSDSGSGFKTISRSGASHTGRTSSMSSRSIHPQREIDILQAMLAGTPPSFEHPSLHFRAKVDPGKESGTDTDSSLNSNSLKGRLQAASASATSLTFAESALPERSATVKLERQSHPHHPYHTAPSSVNAKVFASESTDSLAEPASLEGGGRQRLRSASRAGLQGLRELLKNFRIASTQFGAEWAVSKESLLDGSLGRSSSKLGRRESDSQNEPVPSSFFSSSGSKRRSWIGQHGSDADRSGQESSASASKASPVRRRSYLFRKISNEPAVVASPPPDASTPDRPKIPKSGSFTADVSGDSGWTIGSDFDSPKTRSSVSSEVRAGTGASVPQNEGGHRRRLFSLGMGRIGSRPRGNSSANKQQPPTSAASAATVTAVEASISRASEPPVVSLSPTLPSPTASRPTTEEERRNRRVSIQGYPSPPRFPSSGSASKSPHSIQSPRSVSASSITTSPSHSRRPGSASEGRPATERASGSASTMESSNTNCSGRTNSTSGQWAHRINESVKSDPPERASFSLTNAEEETLSSNARYRKLALRPEAIPSLLVYVQATRSHCSDCIDQLRKLLSDDRSMSPISRATPAETAQTLNDQFGKEFKPAATSSSSSSQIRTSHERSTSAAAVPTLRYSQDDNPATIRAKSPQPMSPKLPDMRMPPPLLPFSSQKLRSSPHSDPSRLSRIPLPRSHT